MLSAPKFKYYFFEPRHILQNLQFRRLHSSYGRKMSDELYIRKMYELQTGKKLNIENPRTYNEKLQWLKLYDHNPEYITMVDKYLVKDYVAKKIGNEYVIPLLGVWDSFEQIDFAKLPKQFVLKTTHDCGGVYVCKDKNTLNIKEAKVFINNHLENEYFYHCREWPYKHVKPRIIAETYMSDIDEANGGNLTDYKFFCFDGNPKAMFIATDRANKFEETKFDFYDMDFNHLPFTNGHPNSKKKIERPESFELMKVLASKLSAGFPHIRVDFYESNGKVYFGELTLFHWGGMVPFDPEEWDDKYGEWLKLPDKTIDTGKTVL